MECAKAKAQTATPQDVATAQVEALVKDTLAEAGNALSGATWDGRVGLEQTAMSLSVSKRCTVQGLLGHLISSTYSTREPVRTSAASSTLVWAGSSRTQGLWPPHAS